MDEGWLVILMNIVRQGQFRLAEGTETENEITSGGSVESRG
jgi:hypothetical protein